MLWHKGIEGVSFTATILKLGMGIRFTKIIGRWRFGRKGIHSVEEILQNPNLLSGKTPSEVEPRIAKTPGWKIERLGKGSRKGQGWVLREYSKEGQPTGRVIRWHPGGGHHGPEPYWRVSSPESGKSEIIR